MDEQPGMPTADLPQAGAKPPRVWTVFTALVLALFLAVFSQAVLGLVLAIIELRSGVKPEDLGNVVTEKLTSPYVFMLMIAAGQLGFGLAGFLPAIWSSTPFRERVAWRRALPSWRVYPFAMLGSIFPLAIGLAAAQGMALLIPADESLAKLFDALTIDSAIAFVLLIGIAPGLFEEVLFRGYVQQRLVSRWGPVTGIIVTSIVFAIMHVTPHAIVAVLGLGLWWGYVAWRSKSILPTILCHFFVNSGLNLWRMIVKFGEVPETAQYVVLTIATIIGIVCFAICIRPTFWRQEMPTK